MKVGLTYDLRQEYLAQGYSIEEVGEFDSPETIEAIENALRSQGHTTERIGSVKNLVTALASGKRWDIVFNICEGLHGRARESQVPSLLEAFEIPYTFSDSYTLALTLDKGLTKRVIQAHAIPTAAFAVIETAQQLDNITLSYPLFVKPLAEGTSKGISQHSYITTAQELTHAAMEVMTRHQQPALIEQYLPGREFTVGILGTGENARTLGTLEITPKTSALKNGWACSFEDKEQCETLLSYTLVDDQEAQCAAQYALAAWKILQCRDAGRVDFRSDEKGIPHFLEINPLSGLHPTHSDLPILASHANTTYTELIHAIMESACIRIPSPHTATLHKKHAHA